MPPRDIGFALKDKLLLKLERVEKASTKGLYFMDLLLKNVSLASINIASLILFVIAKGKRLPFQSLIQRIETFSLNCSFNGPIGG